MNNQEITHIDVDSLATVCTIFGGLVGIVWVLATMLVLPTSGGAFLLVFVVGGAILGMLAGGLIGAIGATLYNTLTDHTRGLRVTVQER